MENRERSVSLQFWPIDYQHLLHPPLALLLPISQLLHRPPLSQLHHLILPARNLYNLSPSHCNGHPGSKAPHHLLPPDTTYLHHHLEDDKHRLRQLQQVHDELRGRLLSSQHLTSIARCDQTYLTDAIGVRVRNLLVMFSFFIPDKSSGCSYTPYTIALGTY